jgi:hypothetical protein
MEVAMSTVSRVVDTGVGGSGGGLDARRSIVVCRLAAVAALGVAALYALSVPIGSLASLPGTDAPGREILTFFVDHREGMLAAVVLNGIAWCALMPLVFVGLRARITGDGSLAASIALAAALVEAAMIGVALLFGAIAAYAAPDLSPDLARVLDYGLALGTSASAWPTVPCAIAMAIAIRRSRVLPAYTANLAIAVAAVHVLAGVGFARTGAFSPDGFALLGAPVFAVWMAAIGVALLRRGPEFVPALSDA